jgi:hypothetical protein
VTRTELVALLRRFPLAVVASVHEGAPQAAIVGIAVGDELELVFDTLTSSRKFRNLTSEPRVALVMGEGEVTVQLEGQADVPTGDELLRVQTIYYAADPGGRERASWPDITWIRVRPTWLRVSDFNESPPKIEEQSL